MWSAGSAGLVCLQGDKVNSEDYPYKKVTKGVIRILFFFHLNKGRHPPKKGFFSEMSDAPLPPPFWEPLVPKTKKKCFFAKFRVFFGEYRVF